MTSFSQNKMSTLSCKRRTHYVCDILTFPARLAAEWRDFPLRKSVRLIRQFTTFKSEPKES